MSLAFGSNSRTKNWVQKCYGEKHIKPFWKTYKGSSALRRKTVLTPRSRVLLKKLLVRQETKTFSAFFCNPTVHYRIHNRPRLASVLCYMNPVKTIPAYFFKI